MAALVIEGNGRRSSRMTFGAVMTQPADTVRKSSRRIE
jgi:hypothetical protein